jgi:hypothetical protein
MNCWGLAADVSDYDKNGHIRRGAMFRQVLAAFNRSEVTADNMYPTQAESKDRGTNMSVEGGVYVWLSQWLPGNTDATPFCPDKMHLDAPSRRCAMCAVC